MPVWSKPARRSRPRRLVVLVDVERDHRGDVRGRRRRRQRLRPPPVPDRAAAVRPRRSGGAPHAACRASSALKTTESPSMCAKASPGRSAGRPGPVEPAPSTSGRCPLPRCTSPRTPGRGCRPPPWWYAARAGRPGPLAPAWSPCAAGPSGSRGASASSPPAPTTTSRRRRTDRRSWGFVGRSDRPVDERVAGLLRGVDRDQVGPDVTHGGQPVAVEVSPHLSAEPARVELGDSWCGSRRRR